MRIKLLLLTDFIGGPAYAMHLIQPLKGLATVEENSVRQRAVQSLKAVVADHSTADFITHVIPLFAELINDGSVNSRVLACALFTVFYSRATAAIKVDLRRHFQGLCQDADHIVRFEAARHMSDFGKMIGPEFESDWNEMCMRLAKDNNEDVRLLGVEVLGQRVSDLEKQVSDLERRMVYGTGKPWAVIIRNIIVSTAKRVSREPYL